MIKVIPENLTNEIAEVANQFGVGLDLELICAFFCGRMNVTVRFAEKTYEYSYQINADGALEEKRYIKRYAKLSAYKALSEAFSLKLPWGALTGIRPTRLAYQQGENARNFFIDDMFVSESKTDLILKIVDEQKPYMAPAGSISDLFVSIPFCPTRCAYCSFLSCEIGKEKHVNEYIAALLKEIDHAKTLDKNYRCAYVGGGTPVSLTDEHFKSVLEAARGDYTEFTVEAGRPDCITESKLKIMKDCGVTRVCVNPQTFSDKTLALIGRRHTAADIIEKYALVKQYGFKVNMDLIAGLPEETFDDFKASLDKAIDLRPENITVHTLCLKKGSKLKEQTERLTVADVSAMVDYSHESLQSAGYRPYYLYRQKYMADNLENTGYALENAVCVYNIDIMEEIADIVACGANGISKKVFGEENRIERLAAPKDIATYLGKVDEIISEKNKLFG